MRVIAGTARRLPLKTIPGMDTRPTTDRVKETLFNMLQPYLADCRFLDLFAGSGAIGIEALSRGAAHAVFVENNKAASDCIKENLAFTKLADRGEVRTTDVLTALRQLEGEQPFDYIFMDPPYDKETEESVFEYLQNSSIADESTQIILEASLDVKTGYLNHYGFAIIKIKKYKTNQHLFIGRMEEE